MRHHRFSKFWNHAPAAMVLRFLPAVWEEYFSFTIERNPWDMAVSTYYWLTRQHPAPPPFSRFVASPRVAEGSNWPLYTIDGEVAVDRVIKYDSLSEEFFELAEQFGLSDVPPLPRAKSGYRPATPYQEM